ncbi:hypothetical protein LPB41_14225 [Thalassospira sp. MA62]|nr:hypothetical protein [Thalassospira sp. MA62]
MKKPLFLVGLLLGIGSSTATGASEMHNVGNDVIAQQHAALASATEGLGFGPQSPRDIDAHAGRNSQIFNMAPSVAEMTLCDIHLHESAEHKGGEFTTYVGNGDGHGFGTGYRYNGSLSDAETVPVEMPIGQSDHGDLAPGDTIEIHFVHSTANATLGPGLGTCLTEATQNPQLRVEAVIAVLVSNGGENFREMALIEQLDGRYQVPHLPENLGDPIVYRGSTTGPAYNETGSPFQVTWSVRPKVVKLNILDLGAWLKDNPFHEDHAHGVRNLVVNPDLLSPIE